ncbi:MAG: hypothetical protein K9H49_07555 [Bacteroidales bacterium]|nr:hypothetical protein [Bacteroidales bacterium]MCF8404489.1 hypothetical protein [Bacteroidales bacterium]
MKKLIFLGAVLFLASLPANVLAQIPGDVKVIDTLSVAISDTLTLHRDEILIGKVAAYDPEKKHVGYQLLPSITSVVFSIHKTSGMLTMKTKYLWWLCEAGSHILMVQVSDGLNVTTSSILLQFDCR